MKKPTDGTRPRTRKIKLPTGRPGTKPAEIGKEGGVGSDFDRSPGSSSRYVGSSGRVENDDKIG